MKLLLKINEKPRELEISPGETLLDALRNAGYKGAKRGCEEGTCGSCVVLVDGIPHYSCLLFAASMEGKNITTIDGLGSVDAPHQIMRAFAEEGAVQCGYCIPGMVLSTKALLDKNNDPSEEQVKESLDGHLCRCTGYVKQIKAVLKAKAALNSQRGGAGQ